MHDNRNNRNKLEKGNKIKLMKYSDAWYDKNLRRVAMCNN